MLSRRVATFLLGAWLGCCLLVDAIMLQAGDTSKRFLENPQAEGQRLLDKAEPASVEPLLNYLAREQSRSLTVQWETAQLVFAISITILTLFSDQKKPVPLAICVAMFMLVAGQGFVITPRLIDVGRHLDLGDGGAVVALTNQYATLSSMYAGLEGLKLLMGGVLASYYFMMESIVRRSRRGGKPHNHEETVLASERLR